MSLDEKNAVGVVTTNNVSSAEEDVYHETIDHDDPNNYFTHYIDEHNPRGLRRPTKAEGRTLRRILGHAPYTAYLLCLIEFAERASYYGVQGCLANFVQRPLPKGGSNTGAPPRGSELQAGALGLGLQTSSAMTLLLTFLAYVTPLYGGFIADTNLGKFKAIWIGVFVGAVSHVLFIIAAIPSVIESGHGIGPTVLAILTLAVGTGFIKPNLLPLLMDQYPVDIDVVKVLPSGEEVIVDRQKSLERMTLVFYWSINIGAFLQLATSYCERDVGFWLAFLIPGIIYIVMPMVLVYLKPRVKKAAPEGTVIQQAWRVTRVTFRGNWIKRWRQGQLWEYARPEVMAARGEHYYKEKTQLPITWDDAWVLDIKQTFNSCKIFIWYPIFLINDGGIGSVQTSQAGSMSTKGVPNDLFNNFNPLTIIILIPIMDYGVYPLLRRYNLDFKPIWRITFGFCLAATSQIAGLVIQYRIYETSPCGYQATNCEAGVLPLLAWLEVILYILQAASECFAMTSGYELAYTRSPPKMKGLVMAIFLFMSAILAAISQALVLTLVDPHLIWPFALMAIVGFVAAGLFWFQFRNLHVEMEQERLSREHMQYGEHHEEAHEAEKRLGEFSISHGGIDNDDNLVAVSSLKAAVGK